MTLLRSQSTLQKTSWSPSMLRRMFKKSHLLGPFFFLSISWWIQRAVRSYVVSAAAAISLLELKSDWDLLLSFGNDSDPLWLSAANPIELTLISRSPPLASSAHCCQVMCRKYPGLNWVFGLLEAIGSISDEQELFCMIFQIFWYCFMN